MSPRCHPENRGQETFRVIDAEFQPLRLKIDAGSRTTELAVVNEDTGDIVFAAELFAFQHLIR